MVLRSRYSQLLAFALLAAVAIFASLTACGNFFPSANAITSITLSPLNAMVAPGGVQQYTATGTFGNNTTGDVSSQVTWGSSATNIATINGTGLATAGSTLGTTTISAKSGSVFAQTGLTVSNSTVTSVTVSPSSLSLIAGQTQQLSATANFSNNSSSNVTNSATWNSSSTSVATVSSTGLVTAVATGTATVTASFGGQAGNATVTVQ
jgi:hypothetical protein